MTKDERKAIQPLLDEVNNVQEPRAFRMASDIKDPYCSCIPNVDIGFNIMFPNEWEVSVRWGEGHYCDGGKTTVEVAVFDPEENWCIYHDGDNKLYHIPDTDVMGHVTPETLFNILRKVSER